MEEVALAPAASAATIVGREIPPPQQTQVEILAEMLSAVAPGVLVPLDHITMRLWSKPWSKASPVATRLQTLITKLRAATSRGIELIRGEGYRWAAGMGAAVQEQDEAVKQPPDPQKVVPLRRVKRQPREETEPSAEAGTMWVRDRLDLAAAETELAGVFLELRGCRDSLALARSARELLREVHRRISPETQEEEGEGA